MFFGIVEISYVLGWTIIACEEPRLLYVIGAFEKLKFIFLIREDFIFDSFVTGGNDESMTKHRETKIFFLKLPHQK
jgi:hypothetical protein